MRTVTFTRLDDGAVALVFHDEGRHWSKIFQAVEAAEKAAIHLGMLRTELQSVERRAFRGRVHSLSFATPDSFTITSDELKACGFNEFTI